MDNEECNDFFGCLAKILIRTFFLGLALLILWSLFFAFAGDLMYRVQSHWFEMTRTSFDLINYCGLGLLKITILVFFLFPYLAVRLVLQKRTRTM
ncbi:MAG: hypothetical protein A4E64_01594 [Syntrophorhabdus sp. PtaU1.Bin058]|nr:MAG: hypothetical protein A4E64_01594 [Syntrophorhabdus sp. PtaU1.Bin058]